jgi:hypothetical protein
MRPKSRGSKTEFIPALPFDHLKHLIGQLAPAEQKALQRIVETADLVQTAGGDFLVVPADP